MELLYVHLDTYILSIYLRIHLSVCPIWSDSAWSIITAWQTVQSRRILKMWGSHMRIQPGAGHSEPVR